MSGRTDAEILGKKPVEVVLGKRTFKIKPVARGKSRKFRRKFQALTVGADIENLESNDELIDLVYDYSAELAKDKKYIEDNATDDQMVDALVVIMGLALGPFVGVEGKVAAMLRGVSGDSEVSEEKPPASP